MRYIIARVSAGYKQKPCEEAYTDTYTKIDVRSVDDPKKIKIANDFEKLWYSSGVNHRVENGRIMRDFPDTPAWFIDIETLDELMAFLKKYKQIVMCSTTYDSNVPYLEIYDGYRE